MERIDGVELDRAKLESSQVIGVCDLVLSEVASAYDAGFVHADMSEYNVFVDGDGVTIFDWPQAVATDHANADELLARDVENLLGYFERKYPNDVLAVEAQAVTEAILAGDFESVRAHADEA
jgi:RIO kinase 2